MEAWAPRRARSIPGAADRAARSLRWVNQWRRCMKYQGGCHCGNLRIEFETAISPAAIELRACQCTFCRKHGSRAVTDPAGHLAIGVERGDHLERYAFGLRTAEYLICKTCGVYVAAVTAGESEPHGIAIVNCLDEHRQFTSEPIAVDYDAESRDDRLERRRQRWTPVTMAR